MAKLSIGIVGLPNAGKSTLFRALTSVHVPAESYPFCTIEPNVGVVAVPDARLEAVAELVDPPKVTPAVVEFVDIAGLVEGASRGEGLGNRFLEHIRQADAIVQVIRLFEDGAVTRVSSDGDPVRDLELVDTELALADLELVEGHMDRLVRRARSGDHEARAAGDLMERIRARLEHGEPARAEPLVAEDKSRLRSLNLLTLKPQLYVANVGEDFWSEAPEAYDRLVETVRRDDPAGIVLPVSARLEAELTELSPEEREEYLQALGADEAGLARLIQASYRLLGLITFFSYNEKELRAWTIRGGATAPEAAGAVHSDFEERFIRAEAIGFREFERYGSLKTARESGAVRFEGKDYLVQDGEVLWFRTGA